MISAIGDGIKAAVSIDRYLGGTGELACDAEEIEIPPAPEDVDDIVETPRVCENLLCVEKRIGMARSGLWATLVSRPFVKPQGACAVTLGRGISDPAHRRTRKTMDNIKVTVDSIEVEVPKGSTVLDAAKAAGIYIPTLCHMEGHKAIGACRVCLVEIEGGRGALQASCAFPAADGMVVRTNTKRVHAARKTVVELMLSAHNQECTICSRSLNCELQALAKRLGIQENRFMGEMPPKLVDTSSPVDRARLQQVHSLPAMRHRLPGSPERRPAFPGRPGLRDSHRAIARRSSLPMCRVFPAGSA